MADMLDIEAILTVVAATALRGSTIVHGDVWLRLNRICRWVRGQLDRSRSAKGKQTINGE
jgi:hypothetical protein